MSARFFDISSSVHTFTTAHKIAIAIHRDTFPEGSQYLFHLKNGQWEQLPTVDRRNYTGQAFDAFINYLLGDGTIAEEDAELLNAIPFAGGAYQDYRIAFTDSLSPFAIFLPTGAIPVGNPDAYTAFQDRVLTVPAAEGILANDTDADSSALSARLIIRPEHGALVFHADGSFTYTPEPGFTGADRFQYRPLDGTYEGDVATVTLNVVARFAVDLFLESPSIQENDTATLSGSLTGTAGTHQVDIDWDGDGAFDETISLATGVTTFVVSHQYPDDGPTPGNGTPFDDYVIAVRVSDDHGNSAEGSAILGVLNVAPTADAGADQDGGEGSPVTLHGGFTDPGLLDTHTFNWHVTASNGQVVADGTGSDFSFTPEDNGTYTVTFTVTDDDGG